MTFKEFYHVIKIHMKFKYAEFCGHMYFPFYLMVQQLMVPLALEEY